MMEIIVNEAHEYFVDGVRKPSVTNVLNGTGFIDKTFYNGNDFAMIKGDYTHKAINLYNKGILIEESVDPEIKPYLNAWIRCKKENDIVVIESEEPKFNQTWNYTGTPDLYCLFRNSTTVIDYKTGKLMPWTALQLALYSLFYESPIKRIGIELHENGTYSMHPFKDRKDIEVALHAVSCFMWQLQKGLRKL